MNKQLKRVKRVLTRTFDRTDKGEILRLIKNPPAIEDDLIVFTSSDDYTGNPRALFEHMIDRGLNAKYRMIWLFEKRENFRELGVENVTSVNMFNEDGSRSAAAQRTILSARYIFYSHNVNWAKNFRARQTYVDLWHGCGYKGNNPNDSRKIHADYFVVTGEKYVDIFVKLFGCDREHVLPLGYPRNEAFRRNRTNAKAYAERLRREHSADKLIMWMPTFRKSTVARLDAITSVGELGLPIIENAEDLMKINKCCRDNGVMIILKKHPFQADYEITSKDLSNFIYIDNNVLMEENVDLYELLAHTDSLLTDYSSVAIDYLLLDKPVGYTLDDFDSYAAVRDWDLDDVPAYMPGNHIYNMDDLQGYIRDVAEGRDEHREARARIRAEVHTSSCEYSRNILDYFGIR